MIDITTKIKDMFNAGAHYAYTKTRRHPSVKKFLFGQKGNNDIFDLEKTAELLENAKSTIKELTKSGGQVLFLGNKNEARDIMRLAAETKDQPYSCGRYIGGTLTNFKEIRKRVDLLEQLMSERDSGGFDKYTKLERLMKNREIENLEKKFGGLISMKKLPVAVFAIDPGFESHAIAEALQLDIPVIALANNDNDVSKIDFPILANDSTKSSIEYFVKEISSVIN